MSETPLTFPQSKVIGLVSALAGKAPSSGIWTPALLGSALVFWGKASDFAALADGTAVPTFTDHSGNGFDGTQATAGRRPLKQTGYDGRTTLQFFFTSNTGFTLPAGVSVSINNQSIYLVSRDKNANQDGGGFYVDLGAGLQDGYWWQNTNLQTYPVNNNSSTTKLSECAFLAHGFRQSSTQTQFRINDWRAVPTASGSSSTVSGGRIGGDAGYTGSFSWTGELSEVVIFNRYLTDAEEDKLFAYLNRPSSLAQIICDGDSLTYGYDSTNTFSAPVKNCYPFQLNRLLGDSLKILNFGVPSQTLVQMQSDAATQIDTLLDAVTWPNRNVLICWGGTNDIFGGATDATALASLMTYCAARRAAGWKVIVLTMLTRADVTGGAETYRLNFNASIVANWQTFADALVDVAGMSQLQTNTNTPYFDATDHTHLTVYGYGVIAKAVAPVLRTMLDSVPSSSRSAYGAGTAYTFTATPTVIGLGTTNPAITLDKAGRWLLEAQVNLQENGATFASSRTVTCKLRRTNNTAGDITNGSIQLVTGVTSALTSQLGTAWLKCEYVASAGDAITIFGDVSVVPTAGNLQAVAPGTWIRAAYLGPN